MKPNMGIAPIPDPRVITRIKTLCQELSLEILGETVSPIRGKKSSKKGGGNCEYLMLLKTQS